MSGPSGEVHEIIQGSIVKGDSGCCHERPVDTWREIPWAGGRYRVSDLGNVQTRCYKGGICSKWRNMVPYLKRARAGSWYLCVKIFHTANCKPRVCKVADLVMEAFRGPKNGRSVVHISRDVYDNSLGNLRYEDQSSVRKRTGAMSNRRVTAKIDASGEILALYPSAREAARKNHYSYQTVIDRCNGKIKHPFRDYGYTFVWEKDIDYGGEI